MRLPMEQYSVGWSNLEIASIARVGRRRPGYVTLSCSSTSTLIPALMG